MRPMPILWIFDPVSRLYVFGLVRHFRYSSSIDTHLLVSELWFAHCMRPMPHSLDFRFGFSAIFFAGACGYGSLALKFNGGYVADGVPSLYKESAGCGTCYQSIANPVYLYQGIVRRGAKGTGMKSVELALSMCDIIDIYGFTVEPGYQEWICLQVEQIKLTLLEWAMAELLSHPRVMTKLQDEGLQRFCAQHELSKIDYCVFLVFAQRLLEDFQVVLLGERFSDDCSANKPGDVQEYYRNYKEQASNEVCLHRLKNFARTLSSQTLSCTRRMARQRLIATLPLVLGSEPLILQLIA